MTRLNEVTRDPDVLGGAPVFAGIRVPVRTLLDYFAQNHTLDEFLDEFPTVQCDQAVDFLKTLEHFVEEQALPA